MFLNKRLTIIERNLIQLTPKVKSILIGIILSDGWMQKRNNWNPRMGFKQSTINFPYFWEIYSELGYLCSGLPMWAKHLKRGKFFFSLSLQTRQLDCLMEIYNLFYIKNKNLIIKTIKPELALYMDYIILAHWSGGREYMRQVSFSLPPTHSANLFSTRLLIISFNDSRLNLLSMVSLQNGGLLRQSLRCNWWMFWCWQWSRISDRHASNWALRVSKFGWIVKKGGKLYSHG